MASNEKLHTHQKALAIDLDPVSYGSCAEIGAGQEVARWFLVVGGASGTVAKSILRGVPFGTSVELDLIFEVTE